LLLGFLVLAYEVPVFLVAVFLVAVFLVAFYLGSLLERVFVSLAVVLASLASSLLFLVRRGSDL
jgi:hypothetical protein